MIVRVFRGLLLLALLIANGAIVAKGDGGGCEECGEDGDGKVICYPSGSGHEWCNPQSNGCRVSAESCM